MRCGCLLACLPDHGIVHDAAARSLCESELDDAIVESGLGRRQVVPLERLILEHVQPQRGIGDVWIVLVARVQAGLQQEDLRLREGGREAAATMLPEAPAPTMMESYSDAMGPRPKAGATRPAWCARRRVEDGQVATGPWGPRDPCTVTSRQPAAIASRTRQGSARAMAMECWRDTVASNWMRGVIKSDQRVSMPPAPSHAWPTGRDEFRADCRGRGDPDHCGQALLTVRQTTGAKGPARGMHTQARSSHQRPTRQGRAHAGGQERRADPANTNKRSYHTRKTEADRKDTEEIYETSMRV